MTDSYYYLKAKLSCGSIIEFEQKHEHGLVQITLTTPENIPIEDAAKIKPGQLVVNSTLDSLAGVYRIMKHMAGDEKQERKKFLGIF